MGSYLTLIFATLALALFMVATTPYQANAETITSTQNQTNGNSQSSICINGVCTNSVCTNDSCETTIRCINGRCETTSSTTTTTNQFP